ncbi:MAG: ABC transporter substrate-binding protein [Amphritea sp.]|nr:ABC transporter substrate-binding protein [Amphritea sp.]
MKNKNPIDNLLGNAQVSRRRFLQGTTLAGASMAVGGSLLSGNVLAEPVPRRGGHLKAGLAGGSTSDSLDPTTFSDTFMISVGFSIRDNLTELGQDNTVKPALAESWEAEPGAAKWTFKLRQGVQFSNGKPFGAEDVIGSINAHRGADSKSGAKALVEGIKNISADGDHTVVFELTSGNADFPYILTDYHLNVGPVVDGKPDWLSGAGTGLYLLEAFEPGVRAVLKRNPNAWQTEFGFFDSAEFIAISDDSARQSALLTGEVDVINRVDTKTVHLMKRRSGIRILDVPSRTHYSMPMFSDMAPYNDPNVRLALKHAIDRQEFLDKVLHGYGQIGNDHPLGPAFRYHAADIPQREYDPEKAKFYLRKAGQEGLTVNYHCADGAYAGAVDGGVLFQENASKAGIKVNVVKEPNDGYWSNVWLKKSFVASNWGSRPVEDMILSLAYLSDAKWNEGHFKDQQLDQLIIAARSELDESRRREMYRDVQLIIRDQGGSIIPAFANLIQGLSEKVSTTGQIGGGWDMDGGHFLKRWWQS